ncbi:MAG: hypothetical protein IJA19_04405 [Clostridia bacterium]|nr:hypothetical protein [Clostridia bacterium]
MKTGFSKRCITPPYGIAIGGYFRPRRVKGVLDDLYARVVVFDDGESYATIITLDLIDLPENMFERIKDAICDATDIKREAIFINCSHTHTGPRFGYDGATDEESPEYYNEFFVNNVKTGVLYALDDLKESTIETAKTEAKRIAFVRRFRMKNGKVLTNPGVGNPEIDHPLSEVYEGVHLVKIVRDGGNDIYMVNFGCHADTTGGELISADYPGQLCKILENALPGIHCMFLQGCEGDVNHHDVHPSKARAEVNKRRADYRCSISEYMGRVLAGAVLSVASLTEEVKADKLSFKVRIVDLPSYQQNEKLEEAKALYDLYRREGRDALPYEGMEVETVLGEASRIIKLENGPLSFPYTLSAIKIGDMVFAGIGGEAFTDIGNRIREDSPYENTVVCCLTNCTGGYIPTSVAYEEGGYEARSSKLAPGGDNIIVDGILDLIKEL